MHATSSNFPSLYPAYLTTSRPKTCICTCTCTDSPAMLFNKLATLAAVTGLALLTPTHGAADDNAVMQSVEARANVRLATCWYTLNCGGLGQAVSGPTLSTTNIQGNTCVSQGLTRFPSSKQELTLTSLHLTMPLTVVHQGSRWLKDQQGLRWLRLLGQMRRPLGDGLFPGAQQWILLPQRMRVKRAPEAMNYYSSCRRSYCVCFNQCSLSTLITVGAWCCREARRGGRLHETWT